MELFSMLSINNKFKVDKSRLHSQGRLTLAGNMPYKRKRALANLVQVDRGITQGCKEVEVSVKRRESDEYCAEAAKVKNICGA